MADALGPSEVNRDSREDQRGAPQGPLSGGKDKEEAADPLQESRDAQPGHEDPVMECEKPENEDPLPSMGANEGVGEAGEMALQIKCPRIVLEDVASSCTAVRDDVSDQVADAALLRQKIADWQNTFPPYLPAPYELGDVGDRDDYESECSSGGQQLPAPGCIAYLTEEELEGVPECDRGCITLARINALAGVFNEKLESKYSLLSIPPRQVRVWQRDKADIYRQQQQAADITHRRFLTEADIRGSCSAFRSQSTFASFLAVMRHCGRIHKLRGPRYMVVYAVN